LNRVKETNRTKKLKRKREERKRRTIWSLG
jgi:hypothetical protein